MRKRNALEKVKWQASAKLKLYKIMHSHQQSFRCKFEWIHAEDNRSAFWSRKINTFFFFFIWTFSKLTEFPKWNWFWTESLTHFVLGLLKHTRSNCLLCFYSSRSHSDWMKWLSSFDRTHLHYLWSVSVRRRIFRMNHTTSTSVIVAITSHLLYDFYT